MEGCELCNNQARLYCESEQARLCWDCDGKVHGANFLVAKHCRSLLCNVCQTPTPWKASGPKLSPTISVCESCFSRCDIKPRREEERNQPQRRHQEGEEPENDESYGTETEDDGEYSTFSDSDYDNDDGDDGVEDEEDDGENQVVPWSPSLPQPPVASSSSSEEMARDGVAMVSSAFKRIHRTSSLDSDDEDGCSSQFKQNAASVQCVTEMPSSSNYRPLKIARTSEQIQQKTGETTDPERRRVKIVSPLIRFQQNMVDGEHDASTIIRGSLK